MPKVTPSMAMEITTLSHMGLIPFMMKRFKHDNNALIKPPIKPPTTGTISQSATTLPQTIISRNGNTESTISYHLTGWVSLTVSSPAAKTAP